MPRRSRIVARAALFVASVLMCGTIVAAQATSPVPALVPMHEVTDETGRVVHIPVNPERIVSLAPSLTETIYALGVQDRLVGDTDYCDYPPAAQKKPKVGGVIDPNLEEIAVLHPDLVLVTKEANRLETVRALENFGIPAYATDPHKVDEIITSVEKLADILNVPAAGKAVTEDMQRRLTALQTKLSGLTPKRVLFVVWTEPLISVGKDTFIADALRKAGAVSIVDSEQAWPQIGMEAVARLQPEYLIFAAAHSDVGVRDFDSLENLPGWRILNAVRERHYAVISDAVIRPAPRIVSAIEDLARQLHPQAFLEMPSTEKGAASLGSSPLVHAQPKTVAWFAAAPACFAELTCAR